MKRTLFVCFLFGWSVPVGAQDLDVLAEANRHDAAIDHGFIVPHAETLDEGDVTVNLYELFFLGVSYGVTRDVQATITTVLDEDFGVIGHAKWAVLRSDVALISLTARGAVFDPAEFGFEDRSVSGFIGTGSLGEYYIGDGGLSLHTQLTFDTFVGLDLPLEITAAVGVSRNIEEHLKLMIELYVPSTYDGTFRVADIVALIYGFRIHWDHFAADLSFIRVTFDEENEADTERLTGPGYTALEQFPLGLPYLSLSMRL